MATIETSATVTLTCATCTARATAQVEHLPNLLAAGAWSCTKCSRYPTGV